MIGHKPRQAPTRVVPVAVPVNITIQPASILESPVDAQTGRVLAQDERTTWLLRWLGIGDRDQQRQSVDHRYDVGKFIVPGSDGQGHSERVQTRIPPAMLRQVDVIRASRKFPFRTNGDMYRWGIMIGLQVLDGLEPQPNSVLSRLEAANDIMRETMFWDEYGSSLELLDQAVGRLTAQGATGQTMALLAKVRSQYSKINEDFWRERLLQELDERYGHISKAIAEDPVAALNEIEGGADAE